MDTVTVYLGALQSRAKYCVLWVLNVRWFDNILWCMETINIVNPRSDKMGEMKQFHLPWSEDRVWSQWHTSRSRVSAFRWWRPLLLWRTWTELNWRGYPKTHHLWPTMFGKSRHCHRLFVYGGRWRSWSKTVAPRIPKQYMKYIYKLSNSLSPN